MATVNKQAIAATFGWAAARYGQHADLQRQNADALLAVLPQRKHAHVLGAGCGSGWISRRWQGRHAQVTMLDFSPSMFVQARQKGTADHYLAGDIESLPLTTATFGLAQSNLVVQQYDNLFTALRKLYRVVRPGGAVVFTTLVQGPLPELHQAWQTVDEHPYANHFLPPNEIKWSLNGLHYQHHIQPITLWFDDALGAIHSLRDIGATHLHEGHDSRILTRSRLQRLQLA